MLYLLTTATWEDWVNETIEVLHISTELGAKIYAPIIAICIVRAILLTL